MESNDVIRNNSFEWNILEHKQGNNLNDCVEGCCVTYIADADPFFFTPETGEVGNTAHFQRTTSLNRDLPSKVNALLFSVLPISGRALHCLKVPRLRSLVLIRTLSDWQGKTEWLGEKRVSVSIYPHHISCVSDRDRKRVYSARSRWLSAWAMARTDDLWHGLTPRTDWPRRKAEDIRAEWRKSCIHSYSALDWSEWPL